MRGSVGGEVVISNGFAGTSRRPDVFLVSPWAKRQWHMSRGRSAVHAVPVILEWSDPTAHGTWRMLPVRRSTGNFDGDSWSQGHVNPVRLRPGHIHYERYSTLQAICVP